MKYKYFCSYNRPNGCGNCSIILDYKIEDIEHIKNVEEIISKNIKIEQIVIINFILLKELTNESI